MNCNVRAMHSGDKVRRDWSSRPVPTPRAAAFGRVACNAMRLDPNGLSVSRSELTNHQIVECSVTAVVSG
jgi:hypothetical protein